MAEAAKPISKKVAGATYGAGLGAALAKILSHVLTSNEVNVAGIEDAIEIVVIMAVSFLGGYVRKD